MTNRITTYLSNKFKLIFTLFSAIVFNLTFRSVGFKGMSEEFETVC